MAGDEDEGEDDKQGEIRPKGGGGGGGERRRGGGVLGLAMSAV